MSSSEPGPAERLTAAMDVWLRHRQAKECSDDELLARHAELRDLLEPLIADARGEHVGNPPTEKHFGSYRNLKEIGRGGVGIVYEAVQTPLGRHIALKLLSDNLQQHPQAVARFRREGSLLARLQHPHIVQVYDAGVHDGVPFHAMERIDGKSLHDVLKQLTSSSAGAPDGNSLATALEATLSAGDRGDGRESGDGTIGANLRAGSHVEACVRLAHSIAKALCAAHGEGILHRDVKPANILLRRDGTPLLSDFGLARDVHEPGLTQSGGFLGTPFYVSPEQASGQATDVDARSDVFSLAVVLYELLTLTRPFQGETSEEVLEQVRQVEPHQLLRATTGLPADLLAILDCAMQRHRVDRYESMSGFAGDLTAVLELRPVQARRRHWMSRSWQTARRHPKQTVGAMLLAISFAVAAGLWLHIAGQQSRIDAGFAEELRPRVEHHLEVAALEAEGGNWELAGKHVASAAKLLPDLPLVLVSQAHVNWHTGKREKSRTYMARLSETNPDVAEQLQEQPTPPKSDIAWFVRGWRLMERGHVTGDLELFDAAAKCYRRAMDRSPTPRRLYHCEYLHALTHTNDWPAARAMADDVGHLWPDSAVVAYWRGFALTPIDLHLAQQQLERAVEELPNLAQPRLRLARVLETRSDYSGAELHIRTLLETHPNQRAPRFTLARLLRKQHRAKDALPILESMGENLKGGYQEPVELALTLSSLGRHSEALASANTAVEKAPKSPTPYFQRATILKHMGRYQAALTDASEAVAIAPNNYDALKIRAGIFTRLRRRQDAVTDLLRVVEINPRDISSWCDIATLSRHNNDLDSATNALEKAEAIDPDYWLMHLQLAHLLQAKKQPERARDEFQLAADANTNHAEAVVNLAGYHMRDREFEQALELLAEARRRQPQLWQGWQPAITTLSKLGRHVEANDLLTAWCEKHPRDTVRWLQLAKMRRRSPEHTAVDAERALKHVAKVLGANDAHVLAERGEQLLQSGNKEDARALFERVLKMDRVPPKVRSACSKRLSEDPR